MKKYSLLLLILLNILRVTGQPDKNMYLGINMLQIPALTINANYSYDIKPFLTPVFDLGYSFNYLKSFDWIGTILTPHCKCNNHYLDINSQSGGYLKLGIFLNLRKGFQKKHYPHLGVFVTNSIVNEKGVDNRLVSDIPNSGPVNLNHTKYIFGLNSALGYEFSITKRLKTNVDFQVSFPVSNYKTLYGYRNYIPGMGYKDFEGYWFPMLIFNLKYRL
jgi:hypothetical protein